MNFDACVGHWRPDDCLSSLREFESRHGRKREILVRIQYDKNPQETEKQGYYCAYKISAPASALNRNIGADESKSPGLSFV